MKFKEILEALEREPVQLSKDQKREFLETVRSFSQLGEGVYSKTNLKPLLHSLNYFLKFYEN